ncbi:MAG: rRNA ((2503)-C(2))-methyltransferase RlmN [Anaerocolumna sp.]|jgi:23S rRNA (adenine2503-C2)-methyltransferase|nr:rRNA ((2503)-C(2))-methyltransferase RlmN [Anaerocolumna sp.]
MIKTDLKSLDFKELEEFLISMGEKKYRAKQLYEWLHVKLASGFDEMSNLPKSLKEQLEKVSFITNLSVLNKLESKGGETSKFLFGLSDNRVLESVLMKYHHGNSVCISSQVGCKMGCKFCASTIGGFERNLSPAEMLDQIYQIQRISGERVSNVVVMGTGEPLDNYDNLLKFIKILTDENGLNISQRNITVSTCGLTKKMRELADEKLQITLALSLHAPNDEVRKELMPVASTFDYETVIDACKYYYEITGRRITFEYSLVEGVNDHENHAREIAKKIKGMNCHVNLIPVNPIKERDYRQSEAKNIQNFKNILEKYGINVTIRREMGTDINAACGQLRKSYMDDSLKEV